MEKKNNPQFKQLPPDREIVNVTLEARPEKTSRLCTLMQKGCYVKIETGKSMRDLLCGQFRISPEYVKNDIKVIFLEYSPVDDIDTAIVKDGATLALSAAMPGVVGAAMRKDGLSWMRTSITYHEENKEHYEGPGLIQIKLFNKVMADLGESFLKRGVYVNSGFLAGFMERFTPDFWHELGKITKDNHSITGEQLREYLKNNDEWIKVALRDYFATT